MKSSKKARSSAGSRKNRTAGSFGRALSNAGDIIVKRCTLSGQVLATGAGTVIPVTSFTSSQVESGPAVEFASFASRYQQYRVRAIRVRGKATQPTQSNESAIIAHSTLYQGDYIGSAAPGSSAQVFSDERVKETATCKDFSYVATWSRNPNAMLWNPTSAAIPSANQFAIVVASPTAPAMTSGVTYYAVTVEWEVEFRGSQ
jgi:hypothetical protein